MTSRKQTTTSMKVGRSPGGPLRRSDAAKSCTMAAESSDVLAAASWFRSTLAAVTKFGR